MEKISLIDEEYLKMTSELLKRRLEKGLREHKLINVNGLRCIGKTYTLIQFAREHGYVVIEPLGMHYYADNPYVYTISQLKNHTYVKLNAISKVLVDEGVDIKELEKMNITVLTGFSAIREETAKEQSLSEKVVKRLNHNVDSLLNKIDISIENKLSDYKMLMHNLTDTMNLIKDLDWKLNYSVYSEEVANNVYQKQIAIWEQNSEGNIRNHKVWKIEEPYCDGRKSINQ